MVPVLVSDTRGGGGGGGGGGLSWGILLMVTHLAVPDGLGTHNG